ncbi:phage repressor protein C with HTH and peptisase S24 domain [Luteibacter jiangsuensis]|uniref:Phage repressor protein C with HTH and peptisase S24 domain n=1 Tax=Luteibacter jiangsuensis TaxID=637577 RepID=A0ABT9T2V1_9GAMM|nr:S24 family peptidase [Luteibacter jiangsuensis]MDQ0010527.1 phage repressor protein C with HTH and peptisase S24 domain [Luteibacter jiangsuensis]
MGNELHASRAFNGNLADFLDSQPSIKRLRVLDDAMVGTIAAGDIITVDMGNREVDSGHCYLILSEGTVRVRRLAVSDGVLSVNADSTDKTLYPDMTIAGDSPDFAVLGRVTERQSDKGL